MSFDRLERCVVRVRGEKDAPPMGAGAVISLSRVLTCAHVIADALGAKDLDYRAEPPTDKVFVDLPVIAPNARIAARVVPDLWFPRLTEAELESAAPELYRRRDLAVLELEDPDELPEEAWPAAALEDLDRAAVLRAFGVPIGADRGTYARGTIEGHLAYADLEVSNVAFDGEFVERGFSGGPAWDKDRDAMIGLVTEMSASKRGVVRPVACLHEAVPGLRLQPRRSHPNPEIDPSDLLHVDRRPQREDDLRAALATDAGPRPPVRLVIVSGWRDNEVESFVGLVGRYDVPRLFGRKEWNRDIPWAYWEEGGDGDIHRRLSDLHGYLDDELGLSLAQSNPEGYATALQTELAPPAIAYYLRTPNLTARDGDLLRHLMLFWNEVGQQLSGKIIPIFLCCEDDRSEPGPDNAPFTQFIADCRGLSYQGVEVRIASPLSEIDFDETKRWFTSFVRPKYRGLKRDIDAYVQETRDHFKLDLRRKTLSYMQLRDELIALRILTGRGDT